MAKVAEESADGTLNGFEDQLQNKFAGSNRKCKPESVTGCNANTDCSLQYWSYT